MTLIISCFQFKFLVILCIVIFSTKSFALRKHLLCILLSSYFSSFRIHILKVMTYSENLEYSEKLE